VNPALLSADIIGLTGRVSSPLEPLFPHLDVCSGAGGAEQKLSPTGPDSLSGGVSALVQRVSLTCFKPLRTGEFLHFKWFILDLCLNSSVDPEDERKSAGSLGQRRLRAASREQQQMFWWCGWWGETSDCGQLLPAHPPSCQFQGS
jgi:hypothetical protein